MVLAFFTENKPNFEDNYGHIGDHQEALKVEKPDENKNRHQKSKNGTQNQNKNQKNDKNQNQEVEKSLKKSETGVNGNGTVGGGKRVLGVSFAPVIIPMERRLQTLAVTSWLLTFLFMGPAFLSFGIYLLIWTRFWFLPLLYAGWYFYDRNTPSMGSKGSDWVRKWRVWVHYKNYFPIRLIKTVELDPKKNYLFCSHPHGVLCSGAFANFATEANEVSKLFPGLSTHLMTFDEQFGPFVPLYRDYIQLSGTISANKSSLNFMLGHKEGGKAPVLIVGGAPESLDTRPGTYKLHLSNRKGFVKIALTHGAPLVPVFSFGETNIYDQVYNPEGSLLRKIQDGIQKKINLAPVLVLGRGIFQYSFGLLPHRKPIYTVVGSPLELPKISNPSTEEVEKWHSKYIQELSTLFYTHRDKYESPNVQLTIR